MLLQRGLGEKEEESAWDKVKQAALENDLDGVLEMGEERRAAVADSAALVLEKGEKRSRRDRSGSVEWDMTPMLDKDDFVEKSQDVFLLQQASSPSPSPSPSHASALHAMCNMSGICECTHGRVLC